MCHRFLGLIDQLVIARRLPENRKPTAGKRTLDGFVSDFRSGSVVAPDMHIVDVWKAFTKLMFNHPPVSPIQIDGSPLMNDGNLLEPELTPQLVPFNGAVTKRVELPGLSWQEEIFKVSANVNWFTLTMGALADNENFILHAFIKDRDSRQYTYVEKPLKKGRQRIV